MIVVVYQIVVHAECEPWLLALAQKDFDRVAAAIDQLAEHGLGLGRPRVDTIKGSRHPNMKELRAGTVRVLFAFDPERMAILLIGGGKARQWQQWYVESIPVADDRYEKYLAEKGTLPQRERE